MRTLFVCLVGEPLNADAWQWYFDVVGDKKCTIVDTWWQTGEWYLGLVMDYSSTCADMCCVCA